MKTYTPTPLDTKEIDLNDELHQLTEKLAENTHDIWAALRIKEGWSYGEKRDDTSKTHPDLIPYEQLSESEKEYDRQTAIEALKVITALGFKITKE